MPGKKRKVWVWLTLQQIDAVLAMARVIDSKPEALNAVLPEPGDRFAFRGAITALQKVKGDGDKRMNRNYSVMPAVARPSTVLVTEIGAGAFMVQGYPTSVAAYVSAEDGKVLREALDAAFGGLGWAMDIPPIVKPRV